MKWKDKVATELLNELFRLKNSYSKLRWYVKQYNLLKTPQNELVELTANARDAITFEIDIFKSTLLGYDDIVKKSSDEFKQPIRNIRGVYFLIDS